MIKFAKTWMVAGSVLISIGSAQAAPTFLDESFDMFLPAGWTVTNNSAPAGTTSYFAGDTGIFSAQAGAPASYAAANFNNAGPGGAISDWLITPVVTFTNGSTVSFYTRSGGGGGVFADNLEVRFSSSGASTNVGSTTTSVGDFTTTLVAVNAALAPSGYPTDWTMFTATVSGLGGATDGRVAFRYVIPNTDTAGDYIGIDTVSIAAAVVGGVPEPETPAMMALGFAALALALRRHTRRKESAIGA